MRSTKEQAMTETSGDLSEVNEADALEQAQAADGDLDGSSEILDPADPAQAQASRWDADQADVIEQARIIEPGHDDEYPDTDEG
jgi:hypothetical protein